MLVKLKRQNELSSTPLDSNSEILNVYVNRLNLPQYYDVSSSNIEFEIYNFESISDNVIIEVSNTSTYKIEEVDSENGNIVVTAEDGSQSTYTYTVVEKSYIGGLPVLTGLSNPDGDAFIFSLTESSDWNIGEVVRVSDLDIDNIVVEGGGGVMLIDETQYDVNERRELYNGVDIYLKTWRTDDEGTQNYDKFVYYRVITSSTIPQIVPVTPVSKIPYSNSIGFLNFDILVLLSKEITNDIIGNIYNKSNSLELTDYLDLNEITYYTGVSFDDVDFSVNVNKKTDINWNNFVDSGFSLTDITSLSKTMAIKILSIIEDKFDVYYNGLENDIIFTLPFEEEEYKSSIFKKFLCDNRMDSINEMMRFILGYVSYDLSIEDSAFHYNELNKSFQSQFTYAFLLSNFDFDTINFFITRLEYFKTILSSYKSDLTLSDVVGSLNVFYTLSDVNKLNSIYGQASSTVNMNTNITTFLKSIKKFYLTNPFK